MVTRPAMQKEHRKIRNGLDHYRYLRLLTYLIEVSFLVFIYLFIVVALHQQTYRNQNGEVHSSQDSYTFFPLKNKKTTSSKIIHLCWCRLKENELSNHFNYIENLNTCPANFYGHWNKGQREVIEKIYQKMKTNAYFFYSICPLGNQPLRRF